MIDHAALHRNEVTGEFEDPTFKFGQEQIAKENTKVGVNTDDISDPG